MKPTEEDFNLIRKLVDIENPYYHVSDDSLREFVSSGEVITFGRGEAIVAQGTVNPHVYLLLDGMFRSWHWVGDKDETTSFGVPGTLFIEMCSYFTGNKAFYSYEACSESRLLRVKKEDYDPLIEHNHDLTKWALSMAHSQLYYYERKSSVIAGSAKERYEAMLRDRPSILKIVPLHQVASYLGITPQHLSRLRRESAKKS